MLQYILKRLLLAVPTFLGITIVTFAIVHLAPGDPALQKFDTDAGSEISIREYEQLRAYWGLDQPLALQYLRWVKRLVTLDFGRSFFDQEPVWTKIMRRLPWTLSLALVSLLIGLLLSVPIGAYSAYRRHGWFDTSVGTLLYGLYSVPSYVMGMALIVLVVTAQIDWLPIHGARSDEFGELSFAGKAIDLLAHFALITLCYTYPSLAYQSRFVRSNMLEVLGQDFIRTAEAKGVGRFALVCRHAFRNTLIPLVTHLGLVFPSIVSGSVILEYMFGWPGIGTLFYDSIMKRDYPTVMALSVITAVMVQLGTLVADLAYAWVDPRVSYDKG